jgi:predicted ABC-type ATPase
MKHLSVFAGPNGSGKTTLINHLIESKSDSINFDRHINADDLDLVDTLDFDRFGIKVDEGDFQEFMSNSTFLDKCNINIKDLLINNNCFNVPKKSSYLGAMLADYLRHCYVNSDEIQFSYETVFSHPSKIDFLKSASDSGWQVYLYFVCTVDPSINCERVKNRVLKGGHDVPVDKIIGRYTRTLENLYPALQYCRNAYIIDNSSTEMRLITYIKPDGSFKFDTELKSIPWWIDEYILSKSDSV